MKALTNRLGWTLFAAHVRSTHVHLVVSAPFAPELIMTRCKSASSRALAVYDSKKRRWAEHGSCRYLWKPESVERAVHYVVAEQGDAMTLFDSRTE